MYTSEKFDIFLKKEILRDYRRLMPKGGKSIKRQEVVSRRNLRY